MDFVDIGGTLRPNNTDVAGTSRVPQERVMVDAALYIGVGGGVHSPNWDCLDFVCFSIWRAFFLTLWPNNTDVTGTARVPQERVMYSWK